MCKIKFDAPWPRRAGAKYRSCGGNLRHVEIQKKTHILYHVVEHSVHIDANASVAASIDHRDELIAIATPRFELKNR